MSGNAMMAAIGNIDDRYVMEFTDVTAIKKPVPPTVKLFLPLAGCLCAACLALALLITHQGKPPAGGPQIIAPVSTATPTAPNNTTAPTTAVPPTTTPTTVPPTTSGWEILKIVREREFFDMALEKFYEDEENEYRFPAIMSPWIIVHYSNGTTENIVDALKAGRATLADLTRFGFSYYTDPKNNEPLS